MTPRRPKKAKPDERLLEFTRVIFSHAPVSRLPGFDEDLNAVIAASHAGVDRHRNRKAGTDWQSVVRAITAAGKGDVLRTPIRAATVREVLSEFSPSHVTLAPAFIKWLRRRPNM